MVRISSKDSVAFPFANNSESRKCCPAMRGIAMLLPFAMHRIFLIVCLLFIIPSPFASFAQSNKGTITPVDSDDEAPQKPVLHYYDKHGEKLDTPVLYLAELDTAVNAGPRSPYPLINGFSFGLNFGDAILSLIGQTHYNYDVSAMMSFHNWFFPVIEAGIGWGHHTESGDVFKVKAKPSFYAKVGLNYNFLYKSKPDYMAYLGVRFGFSANKWDITDISPTSDLGKETGATELLNQTCTSIYGEIVAGLKVKIVGPFSLGWNMRFRVGKRNSKKADPWFVAGSGTGPLGVNICAYFTFGERPRRDLLPASEVSPSSPSDSASDSAPDSQSDLPGSEAPPSSP